MCNNQFNTKSSVESVLEKDNIELIKQNDDDIVRVNQVNEIITFMENSPETNFSVSWVKITFGKYFVMLRQDWFFIVIDKDDGSFVINEFWKITETVIGFWEKNWPKVFRNIENNKINNTLTEKKSKRYVNYILDEIINHIKNL